MINLDYYSPPKRLIWKGRTEDSAIERYHQAVDLLDIRERCPVHTQPLSIALIGYASDDGILRNLGREGAARGPIAFRDAFGKLAIHLRKPFSLFDVGDVVSKNGDVEGAQKVLGDIVASLTEKGHFPLVIGGGHDLAYGTYLGLKTRPSLINFDAHLDLRTPLEGKSNSGSSFLQISELLKQENLPFDYTCLGLQENGNTTSLFQKAKDLQVKFLITKEMRQGPSTPLQAAGSLLKEVIQSSSSLFLNLDLDVFSDAFAPGVSAPQPLGLMPVEILPLLSMLAQSKKVIALAIAELSPPYDLDGRTARLAANVAAAFFSEFS
jgi:formiminoglutamase